MKKEVLVLITISKNDKCWGGKRSSEGHVEAVNWNTVPECGNGLIGLLWGEGDPSYLIWETWMVVKVSSDDIVELEGKVKFPSGEIVFSGKKEDALDFLSSNGGRDKAYVYKNASVADRGTLTGGDHATLAGGDHATLTGGERATLIGGDHATVTGGDDATVTGGDYSTLFGGDHAILTGGHGSTLTGGDHATLTGKDHATLTGGDHATLEGEYYSTLTGGDHATLTGRDDATLTGGHGSTLIGGNYSTLTGGDDATLTGGKRSALTAGHGSVLTAGENSSLTGRYWDGSRYRLATVYVGENGIKADVPYSFKNGKFTEEE